MSLAQTAYGIAKKQHPYYNFDKIFSYNAVYNFILGGRGLGKTYGAKKKAIQNAIRKGEQFIYLRRFKTELVSKNTFFADIAHEFPDHDFRVNGNTAEWASVASREDKKRAWFTMGYFISLSTAQSQKSIAFPLVTLIIFDEFILEKSNLTYLPDEATVMLNFYNTVDRYQDKTVVLFLANSVSITNPYFLAYDIKPDQGEQKREFLTLFKSPDTGLHFVACHFVDAENFASSVYKTRFGQFIAATDYAQYAIGNDFADNNDSMQKIKGSDATYRYSIQTRKGTFGIWTDMSGNFYAQSKQTKEPRIYVTDRSLMREGVMMIDAHAKLLQVVRTAFNKGTLFFDSPQSRNAMTEIFKR